MESGEVGELVTVLKKAQEDLNEQMDFSYFKRMKELEAENKKLKEDYEGLQLTQKLTLKVVDDKQNEIEELKGQLAIKEAEQEEEANLICSLKEENEKRFDKIKEMEQEVGVAKLVHHQNMALLEENKKLKEKS